MQGIYRQVCIFCECVANKRVYLPAVCRIRVYVSAYIHTFYMISYPFDEKLARESSSMDGNTHLDKLIHIGYFLTVHEIP